MAVEMEQMRRRMFQLVPPEALMIPLCDEACPELEPLVPIVEENGERKLKMEFNVKDYKPEEVKVKMLANNVLQVCNPYFITSITARKNCNVWILIVFVLSNISRSNGIEMNWFEINQQNIHWTFIQHAVYCTYRVCL